MEKIIADIQNRIDALLARQGCAVVAIDGSCTSGKTTLAAGLAKLYDCNVLHMDDFFLRPEQRTAQRLEEAGGNVDYERFRAEVLEPLKTRRPFSFRPYDCGTGSLNDPVAVAPKPVTVIEGTYSHHPYFGQIYDLTVCLTVTPEIRERRILRRPAFLHRRFFEEWIPMEQRYFSAFRIEELADLAAMPRENQ